MRADDSRLALVEQHLHRFVHVYESANWSPSVGPLVSPLCFVSLRYVAICGSANCLPTGKSAATVSSMPAVRNARLHQKLSNTKSAAKVKGQTQEPRLQHSSQDRQKTDAHARANR